MKASYKIPYNLDKTQFDREFQFQKDGVRLSKKPITLTVIAIWLLGALSLLWLITKTFVGASVAGLILFGIGWLGMAFLLGSQDGAQRYRFQVIPAYVRFLNKRSRIVKLFRNDKLKKIQSELGVDYVVTTGSEEGLIRMVDGSYAKLYYIVGSVSALMFEEDRRRIVDAYAAFYRAIEENVDFIIDTVPSIQTVTSQLEVLDERRSRQQIPELVQLYNEDEYFLNVGVGGYIPENATYEERKAAEENAFRSSKQYLMIIAPTKELLENAESMVYGDMKTSGGMVFKYVRQLTYREVVNYYKEFYN